MDLVAGSCIVLAIETSSGGVSQADPGTLYQVTGGAGIGLMAFVVTPVATLLTLSGGLRYESFDRVHRGTILRAMSWAFLLSLAVLTAAVVGGSLDSPDDPATWMRRSMLVITLAAIAAAGRLFWFFSSALRVRHADEKTRTTEPSDRL